MPTILPIKDLRDTTRISTIAHESDEPIFITKNGYGDMVVLSMENYDGMLSRIATHDQIVAGARQADRGELTDGPTAMAALKAKHAL